MLSNDRSARLKRSRGTTATVTRFGSMEISSETDSYDKPLKSTKPTERVIGCGDFADQEKSAASCQHSPLPGTCWSVRSPVRHETALAASESLRFRTPDPSPAAGLVTH